MSRPTFDDAGETYEVPNPAEFTSGDDLDSTLVDDPGAPA